MPHHGEGRILPSGRSLDLGSLRLSIGSHAGGTGEMCVMEAAAYVAGEDWTDRPASVSPVIRELLLGLNDSMNDADRQALKPLISRLPSSQGDAAREAARSWMVMDWHCRAWPSAWLRLARCVDEAAALDGAAVIVGAETLAAALEPLHRGLAAAAARRAATMADSFEEALASAVAAGDADEADPALVAARAAIKSGAGGPSIRAAQKSVPEAGGWDSGRRARWNEAWDAAMYSLAVAIGTTPIAVVRALSASSAWEAAWGLSRAGTQETWDLALGDARSIGRDAALAIGWQASWKAAVQAGHEAPWRAAADASAAALRSTVANLQRAAVRLATALVDPDPEALKPGKPKVRG